MALTFTLELDRVIDLIKERSLELAPQLLTQAKQKVNGHITYICPFCGNGSGQSGDGLVWYDRDKRFSCFKCDNSVNGSVKQYDIIDIYQHVNSISDNVVAVKEIAQKLGIEHSLNGDTNMAKKYLDLFCQKSNTAKQYVQKWMPIVAASQSVKGNEKERELLLSWANVVDYE